jgi:hypothetical protein
MIILADMKDVFQMILKKSKNLMDARYQFEVTRNQGNHEKSGNQFVPPWLHFWTLKFHVDSTIFAMSLRKKSATTMDIVENNILNRLILHLMIINTILFITKT